MKNNGNRTFTNLTVDLLMYVVTSIKKSVMYALVFALKSVRDHSYLVYNHEFLRLWRDVESVTRTTFNLIIYKAWRTSHHMACAGASSESKRFM